MKALNYLFILTILFTVLSSCKDDNDCGEEMTPEQIFKVFNSLDFLKLGLQYPLIIRSIEDVEKNQNPEYDPDPETGEQISPLWKVNYSYSSVIIVREGISGTSEHQFYKLDDHTYKYVQTFFLSQTQDAGINGLWPSCVGIEVAKLPEDCKIIWEYREIKPSTN